MNLCTVYSNLIFSQILLIFIIIEIVSCAPKIGDPLYDPLKFEAKGIYSEISKPHKDAVNIPDDYLENNYTFEDKKESIKTTENVIINIYETSASKYKEIPILRQTEEGVVMDRVHGSGYHFDETRCITIGSRILCGYNRNKGNIVPPDFIIDIGNDCRTRGDRLECGYIKIPNNASLKQVLRIMKDFNVTVKAIKTKVQDDPTVTESEKKEQNDMVTTKDEETINSTKSENILKSNKEQTDKNEEPFTEKLSNSDVSDLDDDDYLTPVPEKEESSVKPCNTGKCGFGNNEEITLAEQMNVKEPLTVKNVGASETSSIKILKDEKPIEIVQMGLSDSRTTLKPVTKCVEKNDRIVCYVVPIMMTTKTLK